MTLRIQILKDKFSQSLGLPFKELLSESAINIALSELKIRYKKRLFDPIVTIPELLAAASTKRLQIYQIAVIPLPQRFVVRGCKAVKNETPSDQN
ncbi:hypothetical protein LC613_42175 [Nostoc sphaeroides CHAB 2801]|uniref:hypothetical protein n=1 Tax=Nostoc sphaeroides TaxID=446679 RepID=UPI000E4E39F0|nr:hypothetical protein [Nostoc sphaeroides]MCC5634018.1 hypothetical protein [Nostoc sphaeroides CHAB 2801]